MRPRARLQRRPARRGVPGARVAAVAACCDGHPPLRCWRAAPRPAPPLPLRAAAPAAAAGRVPLHAAHAARAAALWTAGVDGVVGRAWSEPQAAAGRQGRLGGGGAAVEQPATPCTTVHRPRYDLLAHKATGWRARGPWPSGERLPPTRDGLAGRLGCGIALTSLPFADIASPLAQRLRTRGQKLPRARVLCPEPLQHSVDTRSRCADGQHAA